jgi:SPP1 family predicted phage head-tail adaptor
MIKTKAEAMKEVGKVYKDKIIILGPGLTPDGEGGFIEGEIELQTLLANVTEIRATQQYEFNSIGVEATHRIELPKRPIKTVDEKNRIKYTDKTLKERFFEIKTFENNVITCREVR